MNESQKQVTPRPRRVKNHVRIGDFVTRRPLTFSDSYSVHSAPLRGKVVYVHPQGRFHVVEFAGKLGGIRESFFGVAR